MAVFQGAILCFLAGWDEIMAVNDALVERIGNVSKIFYCLILIFFKDFNLVSTTILKVLCKAIFLLC